MMVWGNGSWSVSTWVAMGLMMMVGFGAVISLGVWALRVDRSGRGALPRRTGSARADQELAERFARGEIDEAQFPRARTILHADDKTPE
jgi:putative membrane protein